MDVTKNTYNRICTVKETRPAALECQDDVQVRCLPPSEEQQH